MEFVLKNEELTVGFCSRGGSLCSIRDKEGTEYLWQGDGAYWSGQAPVLFPICGSLRNNQAQIGKGQITQMPRHGIVRKRNFVCHKQDKGEIVFRIESDKEMEKQFPYPFRLDIRYILEGSQITTEYTVTNLGNQEMPFQIGGHPGFNCPLFAGERYEDYQLVFSQEETCTVPTPVTETGLIDMENRIAFLHNQRILPLCHELFSKDAIILDEIHSREVTLCSKNHKKGISLVFLDFPYLVLWSSANSGPFIALEPWMGLSTCSDEGDVFEEKRNIQKVAPGESKKYSFVIRFAMCFPDVYEKRV